MNAIVSHGIELIAVDSGVAYAASQSFEPGDCVTGFSGPITTELGLHTLQIEPGLHMELGHSVGLLAHGCSPNCVLDMHGRELLAIRSIAIGDLLTIDYTQTEDQLYRQFRCACGAVNCRGWIAGRRECHDPAKAFDPRRLAENNRGGW